MKTMNKLSGLLAAILLFSVTLTVNAQSGTTTIDASATVVTDITFDDTAKLNLLFGNVRQAQIPTANPGTGAFTFTAGGTQRIGRFVVVAAPATALTVTIPISVALTSKTLPTPLTGNGATIRYNPQLSSLAEAYTSQTSGGTATSVGGLTLVHTMSGTLGGAPVKNPFFVGGTLSAPTDAATVLQPEAFGLYSGIMTLGVAYN
jgi:hypothetical protein